MEIVQAQRPTFIKHIFCPYSSNSLRIHPPEFIDV